MPAWWEHESLRVHGDRLWMDGVALEELAREHGCSPREVDHALAHGFAPDEVSFNAGMLSDRDLAHVASRGVHCTLDSFSALRRYGARVPAHPQRRRRAGRPLPGGRQAPLARVLE